MNKHDFFFDLMKFLFNNVNVMCKTDVDGKIKVERVGTSFSDIEYNGHHWQKYENLFKVVFNYGETEFVDIQGFVIEDEQTKVIERSINYFGRYGIEITDDLRRTVTDKNLCKLFLAAFCDVIFPKIFRNEDKYEDFDYKEKLIRTELQTLFNGFELGFVVKNYCRSDDLIRIFDAEQQLSDGNLKYNDIYAVPLKRSSLENQIIMHFPVFAISLCIKDENDKNRIPIDELTAGFQRFPFAEDDIFIDPFVRQASVYIKGEPLYTNDSYFPISSLHIPSQYFIPAYFYFITRINEDIIKKYIDEYIEHRYMAAVSIIPEVSSDLSDEVKNIFMREQERIKNEAYAEISADIDEYHILDEAISKRAVKAFRSVYRGNIAEYYKTAMNYIEDAMIIILSADYSPIINKDFYDVEKCQIFMEHFNIEYSKFIEYIYEDDCVKISYELIEKAICSFMKFIYSESLKLSAEFKEFISSEIKEHIKKLKQYYCGSKLPDSSEAVADFGKNPSIFTVKSAIHRYIEAAENILVQNEGVTGINDP